MKIEKFKRRAIIRLDTGGRLEVNFFVEHFKKNLPGEEDIIEVLNSERDFLPLEDVLTGEILLIGKTRFMEVELLETGLPAAASTALEIPVKLELINGDFLEGSFFSNMPPDRLRLSDYLNFTPQFIYLSRDQNDTILNKNYVLSAKHK